MMMDMSQGRHSHIQRQACVSIWDLGQAETRLHEFYRSIVDLAFILLIHHRKFELPRRNTPFEQNIQLAEAAAFAFG